MGQHIVGGRDLKVAAVFDVQLFNNAVLGDQRITLRAVAHAELGAVHFKANGLGEIAIAVGQHQDFIRNALILGPGLHDKHVIDRDTGNRINALGLEVSRMRLEAGQVLGRTGGGEGTRNRKQGHPLALEQGLGRDGGGTLSGHGHKSGIGQGIAEFDGHGALLIIEPKGDGPDI